MGEGVRQTDTYSGVVWGVCDRTAKVSQSAALAAKRNAINTLPSLDTAMNLMQGTVVRQSNQIHSVLT